MPLYKIATQSVLFIHIPKTGGTTIEKVLHSYGPQALFMQKATPEIICTPQHFSGAFLEKLIPPDFVDFRFAVTRNPVDRMVSEFFYRHTYFGTSKVRLSRFRSRVPIADLTADQLSGYFSKWSIRILAEVRKNPNVYDNHFRPQVDFVNYPGTQVYKFEDGLQAVVDDVCQKIGQESQDIGYEKKSQRAPLEIEPDTIALIQNFYQSDYRELGYDQAV